MSYPLLIKGFEAFDAEDTRVQMCVACRYREEKELRRFGSVIPLFQAEVSDRDQCAFCGIKLRGVDDGADQSV